jgi:hypothetical protein
MEDKRVERAAKKARADAWRVAVERHFGYLQIRYGFRIKKVEVSTWVIRLIYQSRTTAVYVDLSYEFLRVEVSVARLLDGARPPYPVFVTADITLHEFLLDQILKLRAPHLLSELHAAEGLGEEQIEASLKLLAQALDDYAADVLLGDFSLFTILEKEVKRGAQEHQKITLWLPNDAPPGSEADLAEKTQRLWPTVPFAVRRYQRPRQRKQGK